MIKKLTAEIELRHYTRGGGLSLCFAAHRPNKEWAEKKKLTFTLGRSI
jgi:hypothetical protein